MASVLTPTICRNQRSRNDVAAAVIASTVVAIVIIRSAVIGATVIRRRIIGAAAVGIRAIVIGVATGLCRRDRADGADDPGEGGRSRRAAAATVMTMTPGCAEIRRRADRRRHRGLDFGSSRRCTVRG